MCLHAVKMPSILSHIQLCCAWIVHSGFLLRYLSQHVFLFVLTLCCYVHCFVRRFLRWAKFQAEQSSWRGVGCMLLSLSLRTVVLVVIGLGRVVCSGFCVLLKIVLGCSLLYLCSLASRNMQPAYKSIRQYMVCQTELIPTTLANWLDT